MQPIILAGGIGKRLFPISKYNHPKQFIKFNKQYSSFQYTLKRLIKFPQPIIIGNIIHEELLISQMKEININGILVFEPLIANTYIPFIIGSIIASHISNNNIAFFPSDHFINPEEEFTKTIMKATQLFKYNKIITIGVPSRTFHVAYGNIVVDYEIQDNIYYAKKFIEKPSKENISNITLLTNNQNNLMWNTGIYLGSQKCFYNYFKKDISYIKKYVQYNQKSHYLVPENIYKNLPNKSFDHIISNYLKNFYVIKSSFDWQDIGIPQNLLSLEKT